MAQDPRTFICAPSEVAKTSRAKDFFGALGKVGDLEVLNDIGGGRIGAGLRTLAGISGAIRTGDGALPSSIGSTIEKGANWVLDNTIPGIGSRAVEVVRPFNPGVANQAYNQAKLIFQDVKQGHFKTSDIPNHLQNLQNLERLARGIYTPKDAASAKEIACDVIPYADTLDYFPPKHKFMFALEFTPMPEYKEFFDVRINGNWVVIPNLVKQFQRPHMEVEFEDINMYNFKTRIQKRVNFTPIQFQIIDDTKNNAMKFFQAYINALSPITNVGGESFDAAGAGQETGMDFDDIENFTHFYTASMGPLLNKTILKQIKLLHIHDFGKRVNRYVFFSPRFTAIDFDEVNMETSDGNTIAATFVYDGFYMENDLPLTDPTIAQEVKAATALNGVAIDPSRGVSQPAPQNAD